MHERASGKSDLSSTIKNDDCAIGAIIIPNLSMRFFMKIIKNDYTNLNN